MLFLWYPSLPLELSCPFQFRFFGGTKLRQMWEVVIIFILNVGIMQGQLAVQLWPHTLRIVLYAIYSAYQNNSSWSQRRRPASFRSMSRPLSLEDCSHFDWNPAVLRSVVCEASAIKRWRLFHLYMNRSTRSAVFRRSLKHFFLFGVWQDPLWLERVLSHLSGASLTDLSIGVASVINF